MSRKYKAGLITDYKELKSLSWAEHIKKYPEDLPKLRNMKIRPPRSDEVANPYYAEILRRKEQYGGIG